MHPNQSGSRGGARGGTGGPGRGGGRGGGGARGGGRGGFGANRGGGGGGSNRGHPYKRGGSGRGGGGNRGGNRGGSKRGGGGGSKSHQGGGSGLGAQAGSNAAGGSNVFSSLCAICNDKPAKYRCITCRAPYCSLLCNNNHKKTPCTPNGYLNNNMDGHEEEDGGGDKFEPRPMQSFLGPLHRTIKSVPGLPSSVLVEEEERNARVPLSRLMRLVHTDAILDSLSSTSLRNLITSIDSAPNDSVRENRLKHALSQPEFARFADVCLEIIRKPDLSAPTDPAASAAASALPDTSLAFAMDMVPDWQKKQQKQPQHWGESGDDEDSDQSDDDDEGGNSAGNASGDDEDDAMDAEPRTGGNASTEDGVDVAVEDGEEEGEIVLVG